MVFQFQIQSRRAAASLEEQYALNKKNLEPMKGNLVLVMLNEGNGLGVVGGRHIENPDSGKGALICTIEKIDYENKRMLIHVGGEANIFTQKGEATWIAFKNIHHVEQMNYKGNGDLQPPVEIVLNQKQKKEEAISYSGNITGYKMTNDTKNDFLKIRRENGDTEKIKIVDIASITVGLFQSSDGILK